MPDPPSRVIDVFLACEEAVRRGALIRRATRQDKEFHFQDWFKTRLDDLGIRYDAPARNTYPDFRLVGMTEGYEIKGLAYPGREANYDSNSQIPTGFHNGRTIYYVFGRYPKDPDGDEYPVIDLVMCHGDFLNADHEYAHENKNIKGFRSDGDIMIRDRKMYVSPTPFALTDGTAAQRTLVLPLGAEPDSRLEPVGTLVRADSRGAGCTVRGSRPDPEALLAEACGRSAPFSEVEPVLPLPETERTTGIAPVLSGAWWSDRPVHTRSVHPGGTTQPPARA